MSRPISIEPMTSTAGPTALRQFAGRVVEVRHLGKHLHFCTIDEGTGAAAVQVCFELAAFDVAVTSDTAAERTPFPASKSQLKPEDRATLACRLPLPGQSCTSGASVPRVVWWNRAPRALKEASSEKPSKRAVKQAASLARAQQRLAWACCLTGNTLYAGPLLPAEVVGRIGQIVGVSPRQRRVRRPASDQAGCTGSLRLAEKDRRNRAGCPFADRVATVVLAAYRDHCAKFDAERTEQTVVAGFVQRDDKPETAALTQPQLTVVALGIGTKFMPAKPDTPCGSGRRSAWLVRDSHAEILARRSLLRYLYRELRLCYEGTSTADSRSIFRLVPGTARCCLRPGVSFHLYSSTVPCGNASLSRWAGSLDDQSSCTDSGPGDFPRGHVENPQRVHFSARHEGQLAALLKGPLARARLAGPQSPATTLEPEPEPNSGQEQELNRLPGNRTSLTHLSQVSSCDRRGNIPPGCSAVPAGPDGMALVAGSPHYSLSCSDKIARWQCLGLQGTLLMQFLQHPVYLQSCTFGRKFNRQRCERALCCRLQDFRPDRCPELARPTAAAAVSEMGRSPSGPAAATAAFNSAAWPAGCSFRVHHAAMLGTSVLLDPDAVVLVDETAAADGNDTGAKFSAMCGAWTLGDAEPAWHDGRTGSKRSSEKHPDEHPEEHRRGKAHGTAADADGDVDASRWAVPTARGALHRLFQDLAALQARLDVAADGCRTDGEAVQTRLPEYLCYTQAKRTVGETTGYSQARQLLLFGEQTKLCRSLEGKGLVSVTEPLEATV